MVGKQDTFIDENGGLHFTISEPEEVEHLPTTKRVGIGNASWCNRKATHGSNAMCINGSSGRAEVYILDGQTDIWVNAGSNGESAT